MAYKGIKLDISKEDYDFTNDFVENVASTQQNIVAVLGTKKQTDQVFPQKGTGMSIFDIGKNYISVNESQHLANFAGLDVYSFYKLFDTPTSFLVAIQMDASKLFLESPILSVDVIISENTGIYRTQ
jgi:hypothetical protein